MPIPHPIYFLYGVSPDGKYVAAWAKGPTEESANAVFLYPLDGGAPIMICTACGIRSAGEFPQFVTWSPDGKFIYLYLWGLATYAVPLRPGRMLPPLPAAGIRSAQDAAGLPGAQAFPVPGAFPGPDRSIYAYTKVSAPRNIYRAPVP